MLEISVLGPVEVRRDGRALAIPGGRTTELLVRLALDAGTSVRADRLVDELWGDASVSTRRNTLQSKVARLRKALGEPAALVGTDDGYTLAVDRAAVDALAVLDEAVAAAVLLSAGEIDRAVATSAAALARFRGEHLASAGGGDWVEPHRAALDAAHASLLEISFEARLRKGDPRDVVGGLETAVAAHPFHERLWCLLVTALYRSGRQADALAAYQRARARLVDELGLEPGSELRDLERQILLQDPELAPMPAGAPSTNPLVAPTVHGNLPALATRLVGRDAERAAVVELLTHRPLVTIVGPGGIGKTALALAVGRALDAPGGVWLVRLEASSNEREVIDAVIAALGVAGDERALQGRLRARPTVVILDNGEHVLDAVADLTVRLLDAAPSSRLLCTSQAPLGLDGEALFELAPLALADAVALFDERARAHRRGREHAADDGAVHDLCRALDGLPLAIELAAARTRTLSVSDIARRLDDRFHLLVDPSSRKPARQRALGAAIAWSYELLFADDQRGLWALATFTGGAPLAAVEHVLRSLDVPPDATLDVLDRLVTRSLVIVDDTTPPRYRLLESIRAYALEAMDRAGLAPLALRARTRWFADAAARSTSGVRSRDQATHLQLARDERANIDAVLAWCATHDPATGLAVAIGFGWAWVVIGDSQGARRVLAALEAAGGAATDRDRNAALLLASWLEASIGDLDPARRHLAWAAALAEAVDDPAQRARCWYHLAYVVSHQGDFRYALELTDRSRAVYAAIDLPWDRAANALFALRAAVSAGDEARSIDCAAHAEEALAAVDDPWLHVRHEAMRGELARLQHRFGDAVEHLARAADTSARVGYRQSEAYQVASLGRALCQLGDYDRGSTTLASAIDKAEAIGDPRMAALARVHLGRVRRALGDLTGARAALEAAAAWHVEAGGGEQALLGECLLAALDASDGVAGAGDRLTALLDESRATGAHPHVEVFALDALAQLAEASGDGDRRQELSDEADRRMEAAAHFISERDRTDAHRHLDR